MHDYIARIKIQNGRIYRMMRERGIANQAELARLASMTPTAVGELLNFKKSPVNHDGSWNYRALRVANVLGCLPDELFSREQLTLKVPSNRRDYLLSHDQVMRIADAREAPLLIEQQVDGDKLRELIQAHLNFLSPQMREVVTLRFGLSGEKELTLSEVGVRLNLSKERVRQLECKAIRKLRSPAMARTLWGAAPWREDRGSEDDRIHVCTICDSRHDREDDHVWKK